MGEPTLVTSEHEGRGLRHQADEVARRLAAKELESPMMSLDETISIMETIDTVLAQSAARYDRRRQALIAQLEAQEQELVFSRFDNTDAWNLGSAMVAAAAERSLPVTIDIRRHGHQLFHVAMVGTTADNDAWSNAR